MFELPNDRLLIVIGDVTGHGVSSSLLTAMVKASVFRFAHKDTPLYEIVTNTGNMICDLLNKKKLMTFCAVILDKNTGEISICNAGHPYPIIKEKTLGHLRILSKTSLPLGVSIRKFNYTIENEKLDAEEILLLYSDGFPKAENDKGEEFGYENFNNLIANISIKTAVELKDLLIETFKKHHGEVELTDDITFIILRRKSLQNN